MIENKPEAMRLGLILNLCYFIIHYFIVFVIYHIICIYLFVYLFITVHNYIYIYIDNYTMLKYNNMNNNYIQIIHYINIINKYVHYILKQAGGDAPGESRARRPSPSGFFGHNL